MKRFLLGIILTSILLSSFTFGQCDNANSDLTREDLIARIQELEKQNGELQKQVNDIVDQLSILQEELKIIKGTIQPTATPTPTATKPPKYPTLETGSMGPEVKNLQYRLIELYYLSGKDDGIYGNMTASAVSDFQKAVSLPITGIADEETQSALYALNAPPKPTSTPKPTPKPTAKPTSKPSSSNRLSKQECIDIAKFYFSLHIANTSNITFTDTSMDEDKCLVMFVYSTGSSTKGIGVLIDRRNGDVLETQRFNTY